MTPRDIKAIKTAREASMQEAELLNQQAEALAKEVYLKAQQKARATHEALKSKKNASINKRSLKVTSENSFYYGYRPYESPVQSACEDPACQKPQSFQKEYLKNGIEIDSIDTSITGKPTRYAQKMMVLTVTPMESLHSFLFS
jgi:cell division septum initiation protein DivIVA